MSRFKEHEKAILTAKMFSSGLIPIDNVNHDMKRALDQLPPEEARQMKRKFRKMWRKLAKAEAIKHTKSANVKSWLQSRYGMSKTNPSRFDRQARKLIVQDHFYHDHVRPVLNEFEGRKKDSQEPT